eukprot:COSAG02_NODE_1027_length_15115_cov_118.186867_11_plen_133_part_00
MYLRNNTIQLCCRKPAGANEMPGTMLRTVHDAGSVGDVVGSDAFLQSLDAWDATAHGSFPADGGVVLLREPSEARAVQREHGLVGRHHALAEAERFLGDPADAGGERVSAPRGRLGRRPQRRRRPCPRARLT